MNYVLKSNIYADKERILGQALKSLRVLYFLSQNKQIWKSNTKYKYFSNFQNRNCTKSKAFNFNTKIGQNQTCLNGCRKFRRGK